MTGWSLIDRLPTIDEHRRLFDAVGWREYEPEALEASLRGSLAGCVAVVGGEAVAMGRVIGDGGQFFYVQDVAVVPSLQRRGIGQAVMDRLGEQIRALAPGAAFVGIFATPEAVALYRRMGWDDGFGGLTGMARLL